MHRKLLLLKIQSENQQLLRRIRERPPTLDINKLEEDFIKHQDRVKRMSKFAPMSNSASKSKLATVDVRASANLPTI